MTAYVMVPVAFFDVMPLLNLAQTRTALYNFRHTWGFLEFGAKHISTDEYIGGRKRADGSRMDNGTGLSKQSVLSGLHENVEDGVLFKEGKGAQLSYGPNFAPPKVKELDQSGQKIRPAAVKELDQSGQKIRPTREKDTKKDSLKDTKKDSARSRDLSSFSLLSSRINFDELRYVSWTPETILGLSSSILEIPDIEEIEASGDAAAIETWYQEWGHPAQTLYDATLEYPAPRAWERIELTERYMNTPGSPSWWQRPADEGGRKTKAPVTLRNVMEHLVIQYAHFDAHRNEWYPAQLIPYEGPPLIIEEEPPPYTAGYTGVPDEPPPSEIAVTQVTEVEGVPHAEIGNEALWVSDLPGPAPITDEVPAVLPQPQPPPRKQRGMDAEEAEELRAWLLEDYPQIVIPGLRRVTPDLWAVVVSIGPDQHIDVRRPDQWYDPSEKMLERIEAALIYRAAQANAMIGNENSSEVDEALAQQSMEGG